MAKQMMLTLTFKESERWIYDEICKHSGKGGWVKDVLADYIRGTNITKPTPRTEERQEQEVNLDNFLKF